MKNISKYLFFFIAAISATACDDYLDVKPIGKVIPESLEEFRATLTSGYKSYPQHKSLTTVRGDELLLNEFSDDAVYFKDVYIWNDANPDRIATSFQYDGLYTTIFYTNVIINEASKKIAPSEDKDQLIGEAYALRALAYFDLVNLFSKPYNTNTAATEKGVPLALEIDLEQVFVPENLAVIYNQILSDKEKAKSLLKKDFQTKGLNYRFSKAALYTFESRVYLYQKEWKKSIEAANKALELKNEIINLNATAILPNNYDTVESILALEDVFNNSLKGASYASTTLVNAYDKTNDLRFPLYFQASGSKFRFKKGGEINQKCSFRTAELYLNKAEALAQSNEIEAAKNTLISFVKNRYKTTALNTLYTTINALPQGQLLDFIYQERQREFAAEGQRWFDLRRTSQKEIIHELDGKTYKLIPNDPRYTLPFPANARLNNPNL